MNTQLIFPTRTEHINKLIELEKELKVGETHLIKHKTNKEALKIFRKYWNSIHYYNLKLQLTNKDKILEVKRIG